jgi:hypothetical protein
MFWVLRLLILIGIVLALLAPCLMILFVLETEPLITENKNKGVMLFKESPRTWKVLAPTIAQKDDKFRLKIKISDIKGLFRGPNVLGTTTLFKAQHSQFGLLGALVLKLPSSDSSVFERLGRFINIRFLIPYSQDRITISRLAIGALEIPEALIKPFLSVSVAILILFGAEPLSSNPMPKLTVSGTDLILEFRSAEDFRSVINKQLQLTP